MNVMICFEVNGNVKSLRKELTANGYMSSWRIARGRDEITYNLPSTAMWKKGESMSPAKAKEDLKKAATKAKVTVERAIALTVGKFDGMTGAANESEAVTSSATEEPSEA